MRLRQVDGLLAGFAYRYSSEVQLHDRIAAVLDKAEIPYERERVLDAKNRADFWLDGLVIEVKVDGGIGEALQQVGRYINLPQVEGVLLASSCRWAAARLRERPVWQGKPFEMVYLQRQAL